MKTASEDSQSVMEVEAARHRLLLVEDDVDYANVLKNLLEWQGFDVTVAHRGVEGLNAIMHVDFDAIICDMKMPTMSGDLFYIAAQKLNPELASRFIFITGASDHPEVAKFLLGSEQPHLCKPLDTNLLIQTILQMIPAKNEASEQESPDVYESLS